MYAPQVRHYASLGDRFEGCRDDENYKPLLPYIKWQPFSVPRLREKV